MTLISNDEKLETTMMSINSINGDKSSDKSSVIIERNDEFHETIPAFYNPIISDDEFHLLKNSFSEENTWKSPSQAALIIDEKIQNLDDAIKTTQERMENIEKMIQLEVIDPEELKKEKVDADSHNITNNSDPIHPDEVENKCLHEKNLNRCPCLLNPREILEMGLIDQDGDCFDNLSPWWTVRLPGETKTEDIRKLNPMYSKRFASDKLDRIYDSSVSLQDEDKSSIYWYTYCSKKVNSHLDNHDIELRLIEDKVFQELHKRYMGIPTFSREKYVFDSDENIEENFEKIWQNGNRRKYCE